MCKWAISSAVERLPYKQDVPGSNPGSPTSIFSTFPFMHKGQSLTITPSAAAELCRQAAFAGTPGEMYLDLVQDSCGEGWLHIRLRAGHHNGVPIARTDGATLFVPADQLNLLQGLRLNYYGDLSGGGFLITPPEGAECCACGAGFRYLVGTN